MCVSFKQPKHRQANLARVGREVPARAKQLKFGVRGVAIRCMCLCTKK